MLSLTELRRAAAILDSRWAGHRVERWVQSDDSRLALSLYGRDSEAGAGKRSLLLSCRPEFARISEIERLPAAPERPPAFVSYLRAHLSRAVLRGARIHDDDRQLELRFEAREGEYRLLLSIFGRRSNLYILDSEDRIALALRPLDITRPELSRGEAYASPSGGGPGPGGDRWSADPDSAYLTAIEDHYGLRESEKQQSELGIRLLQVLRREAKGAKKRLEKLEVELAEADRAGEFARHGELLKSVLGRIKKGDAEIRVRDYETEEEVTIPLDPRKTPKENLAATFKRYQKLLRRLTKAGGQVDPARERLAEIEAAIGRVEALLEESGGDESELREIAERPELRKLLAKRAAATGKPAPIESAEKLPPRLRGVPTRLLPRRYRSLDDLEIWVGRSDEGNDHLTTRLARGNDLFFHLAGAPGSHVILRTEGRPDPPSDSILDASELAVQFSKQKNATSASVTVVPIKQVKKPKGAKPGLVYVTGGRSLQLRREKGRLERLLKSRID